MDPKLFSAGIWFVMSLSLLFLGLFRDLVHHRPKTTFFVPRISQKFRKGVGGQSGLARGKILHMPEIQASFLYPFSYALLGEGGTHFWKTFWLFLGVCLSPTPSRQPLFETSERNWDLPAILPGYPAKKFVSPHRKVSGPGSLSLCSFSLAELNQWEKWQIWGHDEPLRVSKRCFSDSSPQLASAENPVRRTKHP